MSKRTPVNVKKGKPQIPPSSEPAPFKSDVFLYRFLTFLVSYPIFYFLSDRVVNNFFIDFWTMVLALVGICVISDLAGGYSMTFVVTKVVQKSYNTSYFVKWYSEKSWNILRNLIYWTLNSIFYVAGVVYAIPTYFFHTDDFIMKFVIYVIAKALSFAIAHVGSKYLMEIRIGTKK